MKKEFQIPVLHNIPIEYFIEDLQRHITHPKLISQGHNGTCGAAVLCKYIAEKHPDMYSEIATSLYHIGKHEATRLSLPSSMHHITHNDLEQAGISIVDAIMQGAITKSNNMILEYNPAKDMQGLKQGLQKFIAGMSSYMHLTFIWYFIKSKIKKDVRIIFLPSTKNLSNIDYCKNFVIALTHHKNWIFSLGIPNHYIQVIDAKNNKIKYWSWGKIYETSISKHAFHALVIINNNNAK